MATNPITSDDLTIDLMDLLSLSVSDRVQAAASDSGFAQALMQSLSPIQLAKAFPDYYRRELPDISNFILANRYLDKMGAGAFDQTGGGDYGTHRDGYSGESALPDNQRPIGAPEPTIDEMKKNLLAKGIDVDKTYQVVGDGIALDDPQVTFLKGMSAEKLSQMGFEQFDAEDGSKKIRVKKTEAETMTNDQVLQAMAESSGKVVPGQIRDSSDQASYYDRMYNAVYKAAVEKGVKNPEVIARLGATQTSLETGYGKHMVGNNAFGVKADKGGGVSATTKEFINGQWVTIKDNFRSYANPEESAADYVQFLQDNKRYKNVLEAGTIEDAIAAQGQTGYASDPGYADKLYNINNLMSKGATSATINKDMSAIIANATPEDIQNFRNDLKSKQKQQQFDNFVKTMYGMPSPTTSDFKAGTNQIVNIDEDVMYGKKPLIEGNDFAVPIYTNAKNGQRFDENIENLTPQAIERLKQQAIAAKAAGLDKLELYGAQTHEGHASHGAGTETDLVGYNPDGSMWSRDQRATTALGAVQLGGANRVGLYGSGRGLHVGMADEAEHGPSIPAAWGPGGKTSGVSVGEFTPGLEQELAAYLKGQGPMPQSPALNDHIKRMQEAQKKEEEAKIAAQQPKTPEVTPTATPDKPKETAALTTAQDIRAFQFGGSPETQDDEDLTAIGSDGKPRFKFNSGEGLYVKPEANEYADSKLAELSDRMDQMSQGQQPQRKEVPQTRTSAPDKWAEKVAAAYRTPGTQQRAFSRAQFRSEGRHVGDRGSPNIA